MKRIFALLVGALALSVLAIPRNARALGPVDLEIAAQVGGGTSTLGSGEPNALGLGLGARAGIDILGFYGGVAGMYYVGSGSNLSDNHTYARSSLFGLEGGYNLGLPFMTLRPQLGIGYYHAGITVTSLAPGLGAPGSNSPDTSSVYVEPAITGLFSFGMWIAGADLGVLWVPAVDNSQAAVVIHGQFGIQL